MTTDSETCARCGSSDLVFELRCGAAVDVDPSENFPFGEFVVCQTCGHEQRLETAQPELPEQDET